MIQRSLVLERYNYERGDSFVIGLATMTHASAVQTSVHNMHIWGKGSEFRKPVYSEFEEIIDDFNYWITLICSIFSFRKHLHNFDATYAAERNYELQIYCEQICKIPSC
jgi:hypothetical protein